MKEHLKLLGMEVRDRVTGFSGVVTSISFDLYGCVQAVVLPKFDVKKREQKDGQWFDTKRLVAANKRPVMSVPTFEAVPGPARKPSPSKLPAPR